MSIGLTLCGLNSAIQRKTIHQTPTLEVCVNSSSTATYPAMACDWAKRDICIWRIIQASEGARQLDTYIDQNFASLLNRAAVPVDFGV